MATSTRMATLLLLAVSHAPALALEPIVDRVGLFSSAARQDATKMVREIQNRFQLDLRIVTYPRIEPDEIRQRYHQAKGQIAREQSLEEWAEKQAALAGVNGVYILICQDPPRVQVVTRAGLLATAERHALRELLG